MRNLSRKKKKGRRRKREADGPCISNRFRFRRKVKTSFSLATTIFTVKNRVGPSHGCWKKGAGRPNGRGNFRKSEMEERGKKKGRRRTKKESEIESEDDEAVVSNSLNRLMVTNQLVGTCGSVSLLACHYKGFEEFFLFSSVAVVVDRNERGLSVEAKEIPDTQWQQ